MGCRKNAYRALTAMSEWMEEQQQAADQHRLELDAAQRLLWPPEQVYQRCCPLWLADGPALGSRSSAGAAVRQQRGCNGGCSKDHPRITLEFEDNEKGAAAIAVVSHNLQPLTDFFDSLCSSNQAQLLEESVPQRRYRWKGFLRHHLQTLQEAKHIPDHLIRVSPATLAASQRAEQRYVDRQEKERADCHRKRPAVNKDSLERVLDVCYFGLLEHLDVASIAWMCLSGSAPMMKCAARLAKARLNQLSLTYRVLTDYVDPRELPENEKETLACHGAYYGSKKMCVTYKREHYRELYLLDETNAWVPVETHRFHLRRYRHIQLFLEPLPSAPESVFRKKRKVSSGWGDRINDRFVLSPLPWAEIEELYTPGQDVPEETYFFTVDTIQWGFGDLLGLYARCALPDAKSHLLSIKAKRPATRREKNYVKALAWEARFAPADIRQCTEANA